MVKKIMWMLIFEDFFFFVIGCDLDGSPKYLHLGPDHYVMGASKNGRKSKKKTSGVTTYEWSNGLG